MWVAEVAQVLALEKALELAQVKVGSEEPVHHSQSGMMEDHP